MTYSAALKRGAAILAIGIALGAFGGLATGAVAKTPLVPPMERPLTDKPALDLKAHNIRTDRVVDDMVSLRISSLDARVDIAGHMAQTTLTMTFANPGGQRLEGDFSLQLPADAYVTGYALDVGGRMVDGVLQSKQQAKEAYEERLRTGVDPGLAEVDARNMFRTHVFPILPGVGRTIRISYVTPLGTDGRYELPLSTMYRIGKAHIELNDRGRVSSRDIGGGLSAIKGATKGVMVYEGENVSFERPFSVVSQRDDSAVVTRHRNGETFFEFVVPAEPARATQMKTLRLYWDTSRSHRDDDTQGEAQLVADYIAQVKPQAVDLVLFGDGVPKTVHFDVPAPDVILKALTAADYAGATRFTGLETALPGRADVCLMVSDGRMTLDALEVKKWPCRVLSLTSSKSARRDVLRSLAARNGGVFVDLAAGHDAALMQLTMRGPKLWDLTDADGQPVDYAIMPMDAEHYRVFGPAPRSAKLVASYGAGIQDYTLGKAIDNDGTGALWGMTQIDAVNASATPDREQVLILARHYSVATPDISFIVLETGKDYAEAKIAPPSGIDKAIVADYLQARDEIARNEAAEKAGRFDTILTQWNGQKAWYNDKYKGLKEVKKIFASQANGENGDEVMVAGARAVQPREVPPMVEVAPPPPVMVPSPGMSTSAPPPPPAPVAGMVAADIGALPDMSLSESLQRIPGVEIDREGRTAPVSNIAISTAEWNPDRPYLKALAAVKTGDTAEFDTTYKAMEKAFGDTPGFYFDVAEWLFRKGDATRAAAVARNALELPASDLDTQIILAGRLARYGDDADAIWLDERILAQTPEKPQATRNLALAQVAATDRQLAAKSINKTEAVAAYKRALGLLMKVVLTPWDDDYDGIEIISLMEANHLVAQMKELGVSVADLSDIIDPKLVALMDVDIRITLEWNTDKTDMDLWVDEPSGERVIYNNPKSQLGGRLSNDMTRGYGPEEYLLRNAPVGDYSVLANVFAADTLNRNGATNVTVRLYRDWGRPAEKMESFVIELDKGEHGTKQIGTFRRN